MAIQDFTDRIVMSNFSYDMHFSLITVYSMAKSTHYASIMLDASKHLLCSKLCQHNRLVPNYYTLFANDAIMFKSDLSIPTTNVASYETGQCI